MIRRILAITIVIFVLLSTWQVAEDRVNVSRRNRGETPLSAFIPTPFTITNTFINDGSRLLVESSYTLRKAFVGFFAGTVFALVGAMAMLLFPWLRRVAFPIAFAVNAFPIVGLAPAIVLAFGQGSWLSIVFIAALICYFPMFVALDTAFRETDQGLLEVMHALSARRRDILFKVRLPLALPYLFMAMKLAIPGSIIGSTMGEWLGARNGIGQIITIALYQLKPGLLYASLILIMAISVACIGGIILIERAVCPWKR